MAVFGAVISYFMQMLSFILLRREPTRTWKPAVPKPARGNAGAVRRGGDRFFIALVFAVLE